MSGPKTSKFSCRRSFPAPCPDATKPAKTLVALRVTGNVLIGLATQFVKLPCLVRGESALPLEASSSVLKVDFIQSHHPAVVISRSGSFWAGVGHEWENPSSSDLVSIPLEEELTVNRGHRRGRHKNDRKRKKKKKRRKSRHTKSRKNSSGAFPPMDFASMMTQMTPDGSIINSARMLAVPEHVNPDTPPSSKRRPVFKQFSTGRSPLPSLRSSSVRLLQKPREGTSAVYGCEPVTMGPTKNDLLFNTLGHFDKSGTVLDVEELIQVIHSKAGVGMAGDFGQNACFLNSSTQMLMNAEIYIRLLQRAAKLSTARHLSEIQQKSAAVSRIRTKRYTAPRTEIHPPDFVMPSKGDDTSTNFGCSADVFDGWNRLFSYCGFGNPALAYMKHRTCQQHDSPVWQSDDFKIFVELDDGKMNAHICLPSHQCPNCIQTVVSAPPILRVRCFGNIGINGSVIPYKIDDSIEMMLPGGKTARYAPYALLLTRKAYFPTTVDAEKDREVGNHLTILTRFVSKEGRVGDWRYVDGNVGLVEIKTPDFLEKVSPRVGEIIFQRIDI